MNGILNLYHEIKKIIFFFCSLLAYSFFFQIFLPIWGDQIRLAVLHFQQFNRLFYKSNINYITEHAKLIRQGRYADSQSSQGII
jgi:hypothetical protein